MGLARVRAGRGTNIALLVAIALAVVTGALAFAIGSGWAWWAVAAHAVVGLAIVLLSPWKTAISARGLRRRRPGTAASVALAVLVVVSVTSGVVHALGWWTAPEAMQVHVGSSLATIPLVIWHVVARPIRPRTTDLSRRSLLRGAALAGGSLATLGTVEGVTRLLALPGADRRFTGSHEHGSFAPASMPVTQWLNDAVPEIDPGEWRLRVISADGVRSWSLDELQPMSETRRTILDCTGGWFAEQDWSGVPLDRLLPGDPGARSFVVASVTGYARRYPIEDARNVLLALAVGEEPLTPGHGSPARLVAPNRRGFWWVKWVESIELSATPWWWQSPFPLT